MLINKKYFSDTLSVDHIIIFPFLQAEANNDEVLLEPESLIN
jgi:hypothetical protein